MIEVKNVTKKYGKFTAVDNISFKIKDGEIVGFLGPNGAGKSTTMNMITGFLEPTEGEISVNGYDIVKKSKKAKKQIGYMPENVPLYMDLTVKEFVSYMAELKLVERKNRKEEVKQAIKETGLEEVQNKLIRNLSRGYKQRVSMAGALVGNPEVLILDEPTVGLDPKQIIEIRNLIKSLGKKHTVILSSHILSEISQICERVIIINKGKIVAVDTPENLEEKTKEQNVLYLMVEDSKGKMSKIKEKIEDIKTLELIKENEDRTKEYKIISKQNKDIRKTLFEVLPKEKITILELRKEENTLEDAFIKLVETETKETKEKTKKATSKETKKSEEKETKTKKSTKSAKATKTEKKVKENKDEKKTKQKGGKK